MINIRTELLAFCQQNNAEFSSLRRAIYSTLILLKFLHEKQKASQNLSTSRPSILELLEALLHSSKCDAEKCALKMCHKMKRVLAHVKSCGTSSKCPTCHKYFKLSWQHSKHCQSHKCFVPLCHKIRQKLKQTQIVEE